MRCYLVKAPGCVRLAATGGEARAFRQAIVDERGVMKKKVEMDQIDLATAKPKLLAFINILLEQQDDNVQFIFPDPSGEQEGGGDGEEE